jgi:hypothetical protein
MGRPKGSRNRSTIIREAQEAIIARGLKGHEQDFLDSLQVMETAMQHFYVKAIVAKQNNGKVDVIDANFLQAASIAEKIAPYRHARLSAVKLAGDPNNPVRLGEDASIEELRAQVMKHLTVLAPVLGLERLMAPDNGIAHRDVPQDEAGQSRSAILLRRHDRS